MLSLCLASPLTGGQFLHTCTCVQTSTLLTIKQSFLTFTCWWQWWIHSPDSLWKFSILSTRFWTIPDFTSSVYVLSESLWHFLLLLSLSVQAMKLSTLQPIWRRWNKDFMHKRVFVLWWWSMVEWHSSTCLIAITETSAWRRGQGMPIASIFSVSTSTKNWYFIFASYIFFCI